MIKVLLIEDHEIVRDGIKELIQKANDLRLVGCTGIGKTGIQLAREHQPDVVILDHELPDTNGLEVTNRLRTYLPDTKILIVTAKDNDILVLKLLEAGISGYLSKKQGFAELHNAIRAVKHGRNYISEDMASILALRHVEGNVATPFDKLSPKEMEVALLIAAGFTPDQVAKQLHITKKTVHSYRYRIFEKLNIRTDLALLRIALKYGVVKIDNFTVEE